VNPQTGDVRLILDGNQLVELRGGNPAALLEELGTAIRNSARSVRETRAKLGFKNKG
jgi:hypothetical protein